jgi:putative Holliday junction resolvase
MAERTLIDADVSRRRRKDVIDQMAAVLILQSYLDGRPRDPAASDTPA